MPRCLRIFFLACLLFRIEFIAGLWALGVDCETRVGAEGQLESIGLPDGGHVYYEHENGLLQAVVRIDPSGDELYRHAYHYDSLGRLVQEDLIGGLGQVYHLLDRDRPAFTTESPYTSERRLYDDAGLLIEHVVNEDERHYVYDSQEGLCSEPLRVTCGYDLHGNVAWKTSNDSSTSTRFFYNDAHQLTRLVNSFGEWIFEYDALGRVVSKKDSSGREQTYLYAGRQKIGICEQGEYTHLKIPGNSLCGDLVLSIAIESEGKVYAPIHDFQGNIIALVDIDSHEHTLYSIDPYGASLSRYACPWVFSSKHFDPLTGLVDFGYRFYDLALRQWLTPDPFGPLQSEDLYEYCLSNPLRFCDPDGRFIFVIPLVTWGAGVVFPTIATAIGGTAAATLIYWGLNEAKDAMNKKKKQPVVVLDGYQPPYNGKDLPHSPTNKPPAPGFEWQGKGPPGSNKGSWVKGNGTPWKETLHPDFNHPDPIGPHWDYKGLHGEEIRLYPDGSWRFKP